jgi:glycosyltransferase involved in cell wall biosynthesis
MNYTIAIITPTIGSRFLEKCVRSVSTQSFKEYRHYIVVDGKRHEPKVREQVRGYPRINTIVLPEQTGLGGFQGHRIYASIPFITNAEMVCYLDEDNWYEPKHLASLLSLLLKNSLEWGFALRRIVGRTGRFICLDDCNSLGRWPSYDGTYHHVDTSCYMLRRDVACAVSPMWNRHNLKGEGAADRMVCRYLLAHFPFSHTTGNYTVNYRLGSRLAELGSTRFYVTGNEINRKIYNVFPWRKMRVKSKSAFHPHLEYKVRRKDEVYVGGQMYRELCHGPVDEFTEKK